MADVTGRYRCPGSIPGTLLSFNPRKSNYPAGAWCIEEWMGLTKKRTSIMAHSTMEGRTAYIRVITVRFCVCQFTSEGAGYPYWTEQQWPALLRCELSVKNTGGMQRG